MKYHRSKRGNRGLTLIELTLALAGVGMVGVGISSMMWAVSYGTTNHSELRSLAVKNKTVTTRISAAVRSASKVLAAADDYIILWVNDDDANGSPSLHEIQRLDRDAATGNLSSFTAAAGAPDTGYALNADFLAITDALMGGANFPGQLWASDIDLVAFTLDAATPQAAKLVSFRLTGRSNGITDTAVFAAALRSDLSGSIAGGDGGPNVAGDGKGGDRDRVKDKKKDKKKKKKDKYKDKRKHKHKYKHQDKHKHKHKHKHKRKDKHKDKHGR